MGRSTLVNAASYADSRDVILLARGALVLLLAVAAGACSARGGIPRPFPGAALPPGAVDPVPESPEPPPGRAGVTPPPAPVISAALISTALSFRGVPYRNGGTDPSGFDCSGFVQYVYGRHGAALPREVREQYLVGRPIGVKDLKAGDLVFFETVKRGASHVGMALGGGEFVHAPSSRGVVRVERLTSSYWATRFVGARRVS